MTIQDAVRAIGDAIKSVADGFAICKNRQSETAMLKDRKNVQKAVDISENIIFLFSKYVPFMTEDDYEDYSNLLKKFKKYN